MSRGMRLLVFRRLRSAWRFQLQRAEYLALAETIKVTIFLLCVWSLCSLVSVKHASWFSLHHGF